MSDTTISSQSETEQRPPEAFETRLAAVVNGIVMGIARHWLALFNIAWGTYIFLPLLAPVLMHMGFYLPARMIYGIYSVLCHQLPDHSYFLFGNTFIPQDPALVQAGMVGGSDLLAQRRFIGNELIGYKVALCQRDMAIYGSVLVAGILFSFVRGRIKPPSLKLYALLVLPMAIDGITQMIGWHMSNWWLRGITGALFGVSSVWLAYPYVDDAMQDVIESEEIHIARETQARAETQPGS